MASRGLIGEEGSAAHNKSRSEQGSQQFVGYSGQNTARLDLLLTPPWRYRARTTGDGSRFLVPGND